MAIYERVSTSDLPLYKKFNVIDGRELLVNYVILVEVEGDWVEFPFEKFERFARKPLIRTSE